jgi:hypothetical protein
MNEDQTAVEWLNNQLKDNLGKIIINQDWNLYEDLIAQALKYEDEQTDKARTSGYDFAKNFNK